jgi:hypothetical protein
VQVVDYPWSAQLHIHAAAIAAEAPCGWI